MAMEDTDALLLTTPADIFYTTGFLTRFWESPARPWFVIVPAFGAPVAVIPSIGKALMSRTWVTDIRSWAAPDPNNNGVALVCDALCEAVRKTGTIGVPMGPETHLRMPLADYRELEKALAPRRMRDATALVQHVREIKSEAELAKIRGICQIAGQAFENVPEIALPGTPLDEVFRRFQAACLEAGADWVSYLAGAAAPGGYSDVISPAAPTPLATGDLLMLDTGAVRDGYFCDFDRNYAIGSATKATMDAHKVLWDATEEVLADIRPGQRACDVHAMLCSAVKRRGAEPGEGRFGHGLGLTLTEWPSLDAPHRTLLRAGMVLTLEPSIRLCADRIMVHEENLVLTDDGASLLSPRAPQNLPVIA